MAESKKNAKKGSKAPPTEESKAAGSKVQTLPVQPSSNESTAAIPNDTKNDPEEDKVDECAADSDNDSGEEDGAAAATGTGMQKQIDQSKSNIPIADPEPEDFLELLS